MSVPWKGYSFGLDSGRVLWCLSQRAGLGEEFSGRFHPLSSSKSLFSGVELFSGVTGLNVFGSFGGS